MHLLEAVEDLYALALVHVRGLKEPVVLEQVLAWHGSVIQVKASIDLLELLLELLELKICGIAGYDVG